MPWNLGAALRAARERRRDDGGYSVIELVLYAPLLMIVSLLAIQFGLIYLGTQVASGAARDANRVARVTGDEGAAHGRGDELVGSLGKGALADPRIQVNRIGDDMSTTVSGHAVKVIPFIDPPRVSETVRGPVEQFVPDQ